MRYFKANDHIIEPRDKSRITPYVLGALVLLLFVLFVLSASPVAAQSPDADVDFYCGDTDGNLGRSW